MQERCEKIEIIDGTFEQSPYQDEIYYSIRKRTSELFKHYPTLLHKEVGLDGDGGAPPAPPAPSTEPAPPAEQAKDYKSINKCVDELTK